MTQPEPRTPPSPLPTHITHEQVIAACKVLGLEPTLTTGILINLGVKTVHVTQHLLSDGKVFMVGDDAAKTTTEIPVRTPGTVVDEPFDWLGAAEELRRLMREKREDGDADA